MHHGTVINALHHTQERLYLPLTMLILKKHHRRLFRHRRFQWICRVNPAVEGFSQPLEITGQRLLLRHRGIANQAPDQAVSSPVNDPHCP